MTSKRLKFTHWDLTNEILHTGLELARVPRVPGTRRNSEHQLWHPWILRFLNTNWHPQSSLYVISGTLILKFLTQALIYTTPWLTLLLVLGKSRVKQNSC